MKYKKIIEIVEAHFETLDKLFPKILKAFDHDDIHEFRVAVKKLRAFLKMADINKEAGESFIPALLKTFYGYIGILRNIDLQKHAVFKYADNGAVVPVSYIQLLADEENYWKKQALQLMEGNSFEDVKDKIIKALPRKLDKDRTKKFSAKLLDELKKLLSGRKDDETIHSIRKNLKTILYTYPFTKDETTFPKHISDQHKLKTITGLLGDYIDKYVELEFMKPEYLDKVLIQTEKDLLLQLQISTRQQKMLLKQQLYYRFKTLKKQLAK